MEYKDALKKLEKIKENLYEEVSTQIYYETIDKDVLSNIIEQAFYLGNNSD